MDHQPFTHSPDGYLSELSSRMDEPGVFGRLILWIKFRCGGVPGFTFQHDYPVAGFTLDFYCPSIRLAVEVVPEEHPSRKILLEQKRSTLEAHGVTLLSFTEREIQDYAEDVIEHIQILASAFDRIGRTG